MRTPTPWTRTRAQAGWELRQLLRNGEQLLLTLFIPLLLLPALVLLAGQPAAIAVPSVIAASVLATCFTSLAIATGFERRSGALRYLGTTPLTRSELVGGKALATAAVALLSVAAVAVEGAFLGWRPEPGLAPIALISLLIGAPALSAWGAALAGGMRAEAVLAVANAVFLVLVVFGGIAIPADRLPAPIGAVVSLLPSAALADGLRGASWLCPLLLLLWGSAGALLARRTFAWD